MLPPRLSAYLDELNRASRLSQSRPARIPVLAIMVVTVIGAVVWFLILTGSR